MVKTGLFLWESFNVLPHRVARHSYKCFHKFVPKSVGHDIKDHINFDIIPGMSPIQSKTVTQITPNGVYILKLYISLKDITLYI